jgi:hypothetical protein
MVYPDLHGGTNWLALLSPQTDLFYEASREEPTKFYLGLREYDAGSFFSVVGFRGIPGLESSGAARAVELETGTKIGNFRSARRRGLGCSRLREAW